VLCKGHSKLHVGKRLWRQCQKNQTALETKCTNAAWNARDDAQQICLKQWEKKQIAKKTQQFLGPCLGQNKPRKENKTQQERLSWEIGHQKGERREDEGRDCDDL